MAENNQSKLPVVTEELLEYLRKSFPDVSPEVSDSERAIWMNRGAVGVVRLLTHIYSEQSTQLEIFSKTTPVAPPSPPPKHLHMRK